MSNITQEQKSYRLRFGRQDKQELMRHIQLTGKEAQALTSVLNDLLNYIESPLEFHYDCEDDDILERSGKEIKVLAASLTKLRSSKPYFEEAVEQAEVE